MVLARNVRKVGIEKPQLWSHWGIKFNSPLSGSTILAFRCDIPNGLVNWYLCSRRLHIHSACHGVKPLPPPPPSHGTSRLRKFILRLTQWPACQLTRTGTGPSSRSNRNYLSYPIYHTIPPHHIAYKDKGVQAQPVHLSSTQRQCSACGNTNPTQNYSSHLTRLQIADVNLI